MVTKQSLVLDEFDALPPLTSMNNFNKTRRSSRYSPPPPTNKDRNHPTRRSSSNNDDNDALNSFAALSSSSGPVNERDLMTAAQRAMACLNNDALAELQAIVVENGTPAKTVDELVARSPSGSFLVMASKQGEFYSLEPSTLADFVRSRM